MTDQEATICSRCGRAPKDRLAIAAVWFEGATYHYCHNDEYSCYVLSQREGWPERTQKPDVPGPIETKESRNDDAG